MAILINDGCFGGITDDPVRNSQVIQTAVDRAAVDRELLVFPDDIPPVFTEGFTISSPRQVVLAAMAQLDLVGDKPILISGDKVTVSGLYVEGHTDDATLVDVRANDVRFNEVELNSSKALTALNVEDCFGFTARNVLAKGSVGNPRPGSAGVRLRGKTNSTRFYGGTFDHWGDCVANTMGADAKVLQFFGTILENPLNASLYNLGFIFNLLMDGVTHENGKRLLEFNGTGVTGAQLTCVQANNGSQPAMLLNEPVVGMVVQSSRFTSFDHSYEVTNNFCEVLDILNDHRDQSVIATGGEASRPVFVRGLPGGRKITVENLLPPGGESVTLP